MKKTFLVVLALFALFSVVSAGDIEVKSITNPAKCSDKP
jgi:hypothetical protein